jgi:CBS domain-containing protein
MDGLARGVRVQVFIGESEQVGRAPRYQAMLEYLRREGAAGATITRGIAGFGANSKIRTATILRLSLDLPVILTWIDAPERVQRLLPGLRDLAGSGIIAVDEVGIAGYGGRRLEQLRFDLEVQDVMRREVVSVNGDATVRSAMDLLLGREFRALPVVDDAGRLIGMLANGDLVARAGLAARLELVEAMSPDARDRIRSGLSDALVRDVMTPDPVGIGPTATLATAARLMSERRLKRLPVVDDTGMLVGVLSRADVLRAVAESFPREPADRDAHPGARTAGELMRTDPPLVALDAELHEVIEVVASTRLNRAIVVDADRRPVGIVTDADVLRSADPAAQAGVVGALMRIAGSPRGTVAARDLVSGDAPVILVDQPLAEAARVMLAHGRKVLPVVDAEGRLVGILDRADLLHASTDALADIAAMGGIDRSLDEDE